MAMVWKAPDTVHDFVSEIKSKHHHPRLELASVAVAFTERKPYKGDRIDWGTVRKFSPFNQLWQGKRYNFCIQLSSVLWHEILNPLQKEALVDLHLTRCSVEYEPETIEVNGKKQKVTDALGRVQFSETMKLDDNGDPKWKVLPLDLLIFTRNVSRYGLWCEELETIKGALEQATKPQ